MELREVFRLDMLDETSVSVLKQRFIEIGGVSQKVGGNIRTAYINSAEGRRLIETVLPTDYYNAVMAVWGSEPSVADLAVEE
ncbi:MAG: hypothetical protein IIZ36_02025 [Ruminococcus sp.]|nr:hypothetical protein [Ruminococcus sp.]